MIKKAIRCVAFFCCFVIVYLLINNVFVPKVADGTGQMMAFYPIKKNTIDVLFVGSSHVYCAINPITVWNQEGMTSYCVVGARQCMWEAYAQLKEALQYQTPRLIVLDAFMVCVDEEYNAYPEGAKMNVFGMRFSRNRLDFVSTSIPPEAHQRENVFLGLPAYHDRYSALSRADFKLSLRRDLGYPNGYLPQTSRTEVSVPDESIRASTEQAAIPPKSQDYFLRILDLAERRHIPVLLTVVPYAVSSGYHKILNRAAALAQERGCEFLDYNLDYNMISLNFDTDMRDNWHLNYLGAEKLTSHLAGYIREHYAIPDRRNDPAYAEWHVWAQAAGLTIAEEIATAAQQ
jgi:hypothetical protein